MSAPRMVPEVGSPAKTRRRIIASFSFANAWTFATLSFAALVLTANSATKSFALSLVTLMSWAISTLACTFTSNLTFSANKVARTSLALSNTKFSDCNLLVMFPSESGLIMMSTMSHSLLIPNLYKVLTI